MYMVTCCKAKKLILQQSTIGGYIFDDYRDCQCGNWQISMINEHVFMVENGLIIDVNLGNYSYLKQHGKHKMCLGNI